MDGGSAPDGYSVRSDEESDAPSSVYRTYASEDEFSEGEDEDDGDDDEDEDDEEDGGDEGGGRGCAYR